MIQSVTMIFNRGGRWCHVFCLFRVRPAGSNSDTDALDFDRMKQVGTFCLSSVSQIHPEYNQTFDFSQGLLYKPFDVIAAKLGSLTKVH